MLSNAVINTVIDSLRDHIGVAADRNFERWPTLGEYVWPNYYVFDTYEEAVEFLMEEGVRYVNGRFLNNVNIERLQ